MTTAMFLTLPPLTFARLVRSVFRRSCRLRCGREGLLGEFNLGRARSQAFSKNACRRAIISVFHTRELYGRLLGRAIWVTRRGHTVFCGMHVSSVRVGGLLRGPLGPKVLSRLHGAGRHGQMRARHLRWYISRGSRELSGVRRSVSVPMRHVRIHDRPSRFRGRRERLSRYVAGVGLSVLQHSALLVC